MTLGGIFLQPSTSPRDALSETCRQPTLQATARMNVVVLEWEIWVACPSTAYLFFFIGVQLFYNVVLVSTVQQSESAMCIHISPLFWISFPFRSLQITEQSSPCCTVGSHQLSILLHSIHSVYVSVSISQSIPTLIPPWHPYVCSLCLCLYFCFAHKFICTIFQDSTNMH